MHLNRGGGRRGRGFSLVELMVAITLLALLLGLAAPSFRLWIRNAQVRSVTDALQAGVRLAHAEAIRRNRQVVFFLTASTTCDSSIAAAANGAQWSVRTVPLLTGDPVETVQCGVLTDVAADIAITGPTAICFNSMGRLTANPTPGVSGATCAALASGPTAPSVTYDVSDPAAGGADRPLRVIVGIGGQTRMCDPARTLSATAPDGC